MPLRELTPKEKATDLFNKIKRVSEPMFHASELVRSEWEKICKLQAIIAVDEIIELVARICKAFDAQPDSYWAKVKSEIEKL